MSLGRPSNGLSIGVAIARMVGQFREWWGQDLDHVIGLEIIKFNL